MQNWLQKTLHVNWKAVFHSDVHKSESYNGQCVLEQRIYGHKFQAAELEQILPVQNLIVKEQYHYTHCVQILIMVQQKLIQHMVNWVSKCGFIVEKSFQPNLKNKEGGKILC